MDSLNLVSFWRGRDAFDGHVVIAFAGYLAAVLNVPAPHIVFTGEDDTADAIRFMQGKPINCCYDSPTNTIVLNSKQMKQEYDPLLILAHEMRHAWQHHNRLLVMQGDLLTWTHPGQEYQISSYDLHKMLSASLGYEYNKLPWELDANSFASQVAIKLDTHFFNFTTQKPVQLNDNQGVAAA
jgi:hypothetical protein